MAKLRETLDMLEKREAYLQKKVEKELLVAKQNATKNKRGTASKYHDDAPLMPCEILTERF